MAKNSVEASLVSSDTVRTSNCIDDDRSERLRQAVRTAGGHAAVSRSSGINSRTLSTYLAGGEMKVAALVSLADACDVTVEWLATGRGPMRAGDAASPQKTAKNPPDEEPEIHLYPTVNMDLLGDAADEAARMFQAENKSPNGRQLMTVVTLLYDQYIEARKVVLQALEIKLK